MTDENKTEGIVAPKVTRKPRATKTPTNEKSKTTSKATARSRSKSVSKNDNIQDSLDADVSLQTKPKTSSKLQNSDTKAAKPKTSRAKTLKPRGKAKADASKESLSVNEQAQVDDDAIAKQSNTNVLEKKRRTTSRSTKKANVTESSNVEGITEPSDQDSTNNQSITEKTRKKATPNTRKQSKKATLNVAKQMDEESVSTQNQFEAEHIEVPADKINEVAQDEEATNLKGRRGRRGGRGKRGKKRTLKTPEEHIESALTTETRSKTTQATSVSEGKPGRARAAAAKKSAASGKKRTMFISVVSGEQVEVALTEENALHEYYLEMLHQVKTKGNIYKGVVHNIDTNLQAAFINYGGGKNGFLQIDEIHPEYYQSHYEPSKGKKYPPIQQVIKPGQEILVQVLKEPTGNKGAFLSTWLSLAGRFLVLTPGQEQIGISRKVNNDEERGRLRELMTGIEPGAGLGVIVRTVSAGTSKTNLKNDLQYLKRVWREIRKRGVSESAPLLVYQEPKLAERAIRDYLTDDVHEVWVDNADMAENLRGIVTLLFPRKKDLVRVHSDVRQTLWERFAIQRQLEQIYSREVVLPSGGRLVFDQTEALMAVDINSGKISGKGNFASMALKTNLEAAEAIARQLRLRDIGGQIVIDFIEMRDKSHVREVEKTMRNAMKNDRARHDMGRISSFGLLEIVRQRTASSALAITMEPCPHCKGTGMRRNLEWQALQSLRELMRQGRAVKGEQFVFETSSELALYLLNRKRQRLSELESQLGKNIEIRVRA